MKISIIIPIYNVERYILDCLSSVACQKKHTHEIECILVDDCGNDNSIQIVENFIKTSMSKVEFRLIKHDRNRGLSAARNTGICECTGRYILFLDSDDTLPEDSIYNLTRPLSSYPYDFVMGEINTTGLSTKAPSLHLPQGSYMGNKLVRDTYLKHQWYMMAWNKLCNLNFVKSKNLYFREGLIHEDDMWSFQLSLCAESVYIVRKPTYNYLIRSGSITTEKNCMAHIDAYLTISNKITEYIKKYNLDYPYIRFCHRYILGTYTYLLNMDYRSGFIYFKKIAENELYKNYSHVLQQKEPFKEALKIRISRLPSALGYLIFRVFFWSSQLKKILRKK